MTVKKDLFVCSCSFGKDSLAMLLRLLESRMPVDIILFNETGLDFPEMEEHISKVEEYIKKYTDIGITRLKPEHPFEYYFFDVPIHHRKKTKFNERLGTDSHRKKTKFNERLGTDSHNGFSWPGPKMRWCTDRLKTRPRTKFLRDYRKEYNIIEYVGIAADEEYRLRRKINDRENKRYPLVDWGMTEADCLKYCYDRGFDWGGLYEKFSRVSCWCCPLQSLPELRVLYHEFPDLWQKLKEMDSQTYGQFRIDYSVIDLEKRFDLEDEWRAAGREPKGKAFFTELKNVLKEKSK